MGKGKFVDSDAAGYLSAVVSTAIWSGNFIVARWMSGTISPVALATLRWSLAVVAFLPFALKPLIEDFGEIKKHFLFTLITAVLGVTLFNTLIYIAGKTTTALNISMISILFPIIIIVLSRIFLKEPVGLMKAVGVVVVFLGAALLITKGRPSDLLGLSFTIGDFWMLLAATIWAVYSILLKRRPEGIRPISFQYAVFILGLAVLLPFYLIDRIGRRGIPFSWEVAGAVCYIGILASLTAFVTWNKAVRTLGPARAGMVYYTMPLFSAVLSVVLLGEEIRSYHFISMAVIAAGLVVVNLPLFKGGKSP